MLSRLKQKIIKNKKSNNNLHLSNVVINEITYHYDYCTKCDLLHINKFNICHCQLCNNCHILNKIHCTYCNHCYDFRIDNDIIRHRKLCVIYNRLHN